MLHSVNVIKFQKTCSNLNKGYGFIPTNRIWNNGQAAINSYYIFDLEGLDVYNIKNKKIGIVKRIEQYPANDVIIVENDTKEVMVPATKEFVIEVDLKERKLIIDSRDDLPSYPKRM